MFLYASIYGMFAIEGSFVGVLSLLAPSQNFQSLWEIKSKKLKPVIWKFRKSAESVGQLAKFQKPAKLKPVIWKFRKGADSVGAPAKFQSCQIKAGNLEISQECRVCRPTHEISKARKLKPVIWKFRKGADSVGAPAKFQSRQIKAGNLEISQGCRLCRCTCEISASNLGISQGY